MRIETERFRVERVVGSGSMGTVFRAVDEQTGTTVALKVLRSGGHEARFEREADVLAKLAHPGIVRYVGHGVTVQGEPFLAMEWIEGVTLRALSIERGLTLDESLKVGIGIAGALAAAHRAGIIHRDVKPSNVLLANSSADQVKLVDFGIARSLTLHATLTNTGAVVGTPSYMAPEQALLAKRVGPTADVFALGCILHECVVGKPPFSAVRSQGGEASPAPNIRALRPIIPSMVAELIERMVSRQPADRPSDGAAALAELERIAGQTLPSIPAPVMLVPSGALSKSPSGSNITSFSGLRASSSATRLSRASEQTLDVLGRHVPLPMAVLRSQCERVSKDPQNLTEEDVAELSFALAEAVARFTAPGSRSVVLAELQALIAGNSRS